MPAYPVTNQEAIDILERIANMDLDVGEISDASEHGWLSNNQAFVSTGEGDFLVKIWRVAH